MQYDFLTPGRVLFGWGRRRELPEIVQGVGSRALLVTGARALEKSGAITELLASLESAGLSARLLGRSSGEPTVSEVDALVARLRQEGVQAGDVIVAVGGGSAIDLAKAVAGLITNAEPGVSVAEFLEGPEQRQKIVKAPLPVVALPTTGGTGAEATKNAVISTAEPPFNKRSLRSEWLLPRAVIIDPELSVSVSPQVTAWTGMDAITQCIESYVSRRAQPIPQALALDGLRVAVPGLPTAVRDGSDRPAREALAHAAYLSGVALANSGLGLAHGVAAALGAQHCVPHGLACAMLLPKAMRFNLSARASEFATLGRIMTGQSWSSDAAAAEAGMIRIEKLSAEIRIPGRLSEVGVRREHLPKLVVGSRGNSLNGNPRDVSDGQLHDLLEEML
jgi:alcohol dehydrogenase class IV